MNEYTFKLDSYEDEQGMCYTKTIKVTEAKSGKEIQILKVGDYNDGDDAQTINRDSLELIFDDLNFDGYADMRINKFVTAGANRTNICWLWDTKKNQFVYNKGLSELVNLGIDGPNKNLTATIRVDAGTYRSEIYKYIDGKLTLVKATEQRYKEGGKAAELVTMELKEGNLTETGRKTVTLGDKEKATRVNMLDSMKEKDWRALNVFFSNFSETGLDDFDASSKDAKAMIGFAVHHNVINNRNLFKTDDVSEDSYIEEKYVNATIQKYFGVNNISGKSCKDMDFVSYSKGKYFWHDVFEGSPWFSGSQAVELYDNKDGTFSAVIEDYSDNEAFQINPDNFSSAFYNPRKDWKETTTKRCQLSGYHAAKIKLQTYDEKLVYKLLKWQAAENLKEARALIKK